MTYNVFGGTLNPTVVLVYTSVTVTIVWREDCPNCSVLCTTVVPNHMHSCEQFLQVN